MNREFARGLRVDENFRKIRFKNEGKFFTSILYDYGKELALKCPFEDVTLASAEVKSYFYGNLEQFLAHFHRFTV